MANFGAMVLTKQGLQLQAQAQTGGTLTFTSVIAGDGYLNGQDPVLLTELISPVSTATLNITDNVIVGDGTTNLKARIQSGSKAFYLREIGVMAKIDDESPVLYAYANAGDYADFIPSIGSNTEVVQDLNLITIIGNTENVTANITLDVIPDGSVTTSKFADRAVTEDKLSPESVTTEKVGVKAITSEKIADGAIKNSNISDKAIYLSHLNAELLLLLSAAIGGSEKTKLTVVSDTIADTYYGLIVSENISASKIVTFTPLNSSNHGSSTSGAYIQSSSGGLKYTLFDVDGQEIPGGNLSISKTYVGIVYEGPQAITVINV